MEGEYTNAHRDWSSVSDAIMQCMILSPRTAIRGLILTALFGLVLTGSL
jgi:hypothetical protein